MHSKFLTLSFAAVFIAGAASSFAQTAPVATADPAATIAPTPSPSAAPTRAPLVAGYRDGFFLQSETGDFKLRLGAAVQVDGKFALGDTPDAITNTFTARQLRPILEGTVAQYFDFSLVPDFGNGTTVLQYGYLDTHFSPAFRIRVGKFKAPFGLERLEGDGDVLFTERALPNNLVPNRDVGIQIHGELATGIVTYAAGIFDGTPDGGIVDADTNDAKDLAGRIFLQPFKTQYTSPLRGFGVGFAATHGKANSASLTSYKSYSQTNVFSYNTGVTATGDRDRISPQAYFYGGPVGILAEYVESKQSATRTNDQKVVFTDELKHKAWSVTGSILLTGEAATYGKVKPKTFFVPQNGTWGAVQLVARFNQLDLDDAAFSGGYADISKSVTKESAFGVGVNWYWNNNLKWVLDYEQTTFTGGGAKGADRLKEKSVQTRLQLGL